MCLSFGLWIAQKLAKHDVGTATREFIELRSFDTRNRASVHRSRECPRFRRSCSGHSALDATADGSFTAPDSALVDALSAAADGPSVHVLHLSRSGPPTPRTLAEEVYQDWILFHQAFERESRTVANFYGIQNKLRSIQAYGIE